MRPATANDGIAPPVTTARVLTGGLWSVGWQSAALLASLVATPFVLRLLDPSQYGVLALINVLIGYSAVSEFGMSHASVRFGAEAFGRGDRGHEAAVIWAAIVVVLVPTSLATAALVLGSGWAADTVLHVAPDRRIETIWALRIAAIALAARALAGVFSTPHWLRLRMGLVTSITHAGALLQIIGVPLALWAFEVGVDGATVVVAAAAVLTAAAHARVALAFVPELARPRISLDIVRALVRYGAWAALVMFVGILLMNAEKFLLAALASTQEVAYYVVAFTLARTLAVLPGAAGQVLMSAFAQLQIGHDRSPVQELYGRAARGLLLLNLPLAALLGFSAGPVLALWAGAEYGASRLPLAILAAGCLVDGVSYVPRTLLGAIGRPDLIAKYSMMTVLPHVVVTAVLVYRWGIVGAAIAWTARVVVECVLMAAAARRETGATLGIVRPAPPAAAAALLMLALPILVPSAQASPAVAAAVGCVSVAAYGTLTWMYVLTQEERRWSLSYWTRVWDLVAGRDR